MEIHDQRTLLKSKHFKFLYILITTKLSVWKQFGLPLCHNESLVASATSALIILCLIVAYNAVVEIFAKLLLRGFGWRGFDW
jgi:hypothetical protein